MSEAHANIIFTVLISALLYIKSTISNSVTVELEPCHLIFIAIQSGKHCTVRTLQVVICR